MLGHMKLITTQEPSGRFVVRVSGTYSSPEAAARAIKRLASSLTIDGKNAAAVALGSKGGRAAAGEKKRRSPEFYQRLAAIGVAAHRQKAAERAALKIQTPRMKTKEVSGG